MRRRRPPRVFPDHSFQLVQRQSYLVQRVSDSLAPGAGSARWEPSAVYGRLIGVVNLVSEHPGERGFAEDTG